MEILMAGDGVPSQETAMLLIAIDGAKRGQRVSLWSTTAERTSEMFSLGDAMVDAIDVHKVYMGLGDQRILFAGGGSIHFLNGQKDRPVRSDLYIAGPGMTEDLMARVYLP